MIRKSCGSAAPGVVEAESVALVIVDDVFDRERGVAVDIAI